MKKLLKFFTSSKKEIRFDSGEIDIELNLEHEQRVIQKQMDKYVNYKHHIFV